MNQVGLHISIHGFLPSIVVMHQSISAKTLPGLATILLKRAASSSQSPVTAPAFTSDYEFSLAYRLLQYQSERTALTIRFHQLTFIPNTDGWPVQQVALRCFTKRLSETEVHVGSLRKNCRFDLGPWNW